jgi:hypothetical protein
MFGEGERRIRERGIRRIREEMKDMNGEWNGTIEFGDEMGIITFFFFIEPVDADTVELVEGDERMGESIESGDSIEKRSDTCFEKMFGEMRRVDVNILREDGERDILVDEHGLPREELGEKIGRDDVRHEEERKGILWRDTISLLKENKNSSEIERERK